MSKTKVPIVAIVGRANVGKSSFFNAVLERREAIVANEPGTTRDSIMAKAEVNGNNFWLIDTAGLKDAQDDFEFTIQEQILQAADSADLIIVMTEATTVVTEEDRRVAKMALHSRKPVILIVNKVDQAKRQALDHFQRLGIKPIFHTAVSQNRGVDEVLEQLSADLPKAKIKEDDDRIRVALLGRPNVGKSALFNALSKKQQAIVADRAGTTRDINRSIIRYHSREIEILDTAGIRRSGKIEKGIEKFSVIRSLSAIEQSDICILVVDAHDSSVQLDQKIAGMIKESGKGLIIAVSKWDSLESINQKIADENEKAVPALTRPQKKGLANTVETSDDGVITKTPFTRDIMARHIKNDFDFVPWAPLIFTSSVSGQNITKLFDIALEIVAERGKKIKTTEINRWLRKVTDEHPPAGLKNRSPKLNYITQEADNPTPAFKVYGAHTRYLHWSYKRFMERKLREKYGFNGTPVQFWFFEKHATHKHGRSPTKEQHNPK